MPYRVVMVGRPHRWPDVFVPGTAHRIYRRAIEQCDRWQRACTSLTEEFGWHFQWFVIDERSGEKLYESQDW
jgi:hypothetical protein